MTKDEVNKLMKEAGPLVKMPFDQWCERFANFVAAAEREECAKLCNDLDDDIVDGLAGWQYAEAIRARTTP